MKFYKNTEFPNKTHNGWTSIDVFMSDKNGNLCIGYYSFTDEEWIFKFYDGFFDKKSFIWCYTPNNIDKILNNN